MSHWISACGIASTRKLLLLAAISISLALSLGHGERAIVQAATREPMIAAAPTPAPRLPDSQPITTKQQTSYSGWFTIIWGDGQPGSKIAMESYWLIDDEGRSIPLSLNETLARPWGGVLALNRKRVQVQGVSSPSGSLSTGPASLQVESIQLEPVPQAVEANSVSGSQPWVSILCKFADLADEPNPLAYFQNMYSSSYPGLDHYWREQSYNVINVAGSSAAGWFTLPRPKSSYLYDQNGDGYPDLDFWRAVEDCTNVAEAAVYFPNYVGINLMFNDDLGCCAYGTGGWELNLDGVSRVWRITWEPPWGYQNITVIGHEMGHGFGLPHSGGNQQTYNNPWDVMGDTWSYCYLSTDLTYGCLGQHTIAYHKGDLLGWIPAERKYVANWNSQATITLEQLALPQTNNYEVAQILTCSGSYFYTVEARRHAGYDIKVPGEAVIIHEVDTTRGDPAMVVDADNNGDTGDAGAMWTVGETFTDSTHGISVKVNTATATGFTVTIKNFPNTALCRPDPPILLSPSDNAVLNSRTLDFMWQSSNSPNENGYTFRLSASPNPEKQPWIVDTTLSDTTTFYSYNVTTDGTYYWHMQTRNTVGQSSNWVSRRLSVDTQAPTVAIISPGQDEYLTTNQVVVEASASDSQSGVIGVQFYAGYDNGAGWNWYDSYWDGDPSDGWVWVWDAPGVPDQSGIVIEVSVWDQAYNWNYIVQNVGLDRISPTSAVLPLPMQSPSSFTVAWAGSDATSGIATYDVQYKDGNGGAWTNWQANVNVTSASFNGIVGHTYYFRSRARDTAGNVEAWPASADAQTQAAHILKIFLPLILR